MNNIGASAGHFEGCRVATIYQANKMILDAGVRRIPSRNRDLAGQFKVRYLVEIFLEAFLAIKPAI